MATESERRMEDLVRGLEELRTTIERATETEEESTRQTEQVVRQAERAETTGGGMGGAPAGPGLLRGAAGVLGELAPGILGADSRAVAALEAAPRLAGVSAAATTALAPGVGEAAPTVGAVAEAVAARAVRPRIAAARGAAGALAQIAQQLALGGEEMTDEILVPIAETLGREAEIRVGALEAAREAIDPALSRLLGIDLSAADVTPETLVGRARDVSRAEH